MTLRQRVRRDQSRHADDWLITYADTITLLLCLFVITLTIKTGTIKTDAKFPAPAPAVQTVVQDGIFWGQPAIRSEMPVTETATGEPPLAAIGPDADIQAPGIEVAAPRPAAPPDNSVAVVATATPVRVDRPAVPEPARSALPNVVERLVARGTPVVAQSGDRITTLQIGSAAFFGSGSATLSNAGKAILSDVAVSLVSRQFAAYHITIEGHTDDTPISTAQFQSNWELSAARAAAVVRFLLELGVPAGKLTASGFADTVPIAPNRNVDGTVLPENQASNRRVVIRLERIEKAKP